MPLRFAWDARETAANVRNHGIGSSEAASAFADSQSITIPDPDHSAEENRFILIGCPRTQLLVVVVHVECGAITRIISAPPPAVRNGECMKKARKSERAVVRDEMRAEYDFSGGVRGKYAALFAKGTNLVLLAPDVAAVFPTATAVNKALRAIIRERSKSRTA